MRKLWIAVGVVFVLVIAAVLIIPHLIDINHYHDQIQGQLAQKLGRQVSLGKMSFSVFPPSFQVEDTVIGEDKRLGTGRPFATAEKLSVHVKFWPLLAKQLQISSLELDQPRIELVRSPQGDWNFVTLGAQTPKPSPGEKTAETKIEDTPSLANVRIVDGQVAITDNQKRQPRTIYDHIDLDLSNFVPGEQFSVKATAHLPGEGRQAIYLNGKGGPLQTSDMLNTEFDGTIKLEQVSIAGAEKFLNSKQLDGMEGQISGDARIKNSAGKIISSGTIKLEGLKVRNTAFGYPIALDYDLADDLKIDLLSIQRGEIKLGPTPVTIAGTIDSKPTPAHIDLKITATNASIEEGARLASAFGVAFSPGMDVKGTITANIQAKGDAGNPTLNGRLSARDLVVSGKGIPQPVTVKSIELALTPDAIRSNDFTATTGGTSLTANVALTQYSGNGTINAALRAGHAQLSEVLDIAKAWGVTAVEGITGDGTLDLDVHAQGPTKNMAALNFNGKGKLQNSTLKLPSLTKPVKIVNADLNFSQSSIALENVKAGIGQTTATGNMTLKNFATPHSEVQFTLSADKLNVDELQQLQAPAKRAETGTPAFWKVVPEARADSLPVSTPEPSMLSKMTGGGVITAGSVQYGDLLMNNVHSNVALDRGLISINPITSDVYNGKQSGSVAIDTRPALTVYTVNLKTDKVDANKLLSSVSSIKKMLYGLLTSNVNASFTADTADAIARSLNGKVNLNLNDGKLTGLDVMHELAAVGKFLGKTANSPSQGYTSITSLTGNFDVKNGVAVTNDLKAVLNGSSRAGAGSINLASESLAMHVTAVLTKTLSQQVGGTQVGGLMSTALTNSQGELVIPILVTGSFQHPLVAPDVEQFARMKLQNLIPNSKNPASFIQGILGAAAGDKQQQDPQPNAQPNGAAQPQQPPSKDPFGDLLKGVLKKKDAKKQ